MISALVLVAALVTTAHASVAPVAVGKRHSTLARLCCPHECVRADPSKGRLVFDGLDDSHTLGSARKWALYAKRDGGKHVINCTLIDLPQNAPKPIAIDW